MFRDDVAARLRADELGSGYLRPAYDDYCFGNVPATVAARFGVGLDGPTLPDDAAGPLDGAGTVVVVLVDGFGLDQWRRHAPGTFFERLSERGTVTPLTSVYPSETAAALTTFERACPPAVHGSVGWNCYRRDHDAVVEFLPFTLKDGRDAGEALGVERGDLSTGDPFVDRLTDAGVPVRQVYPEALLPDEDAPEGTTGYGSLDGFARRLREAVASTAGGYVYAYLPHVDTAGHEVGTRHDDYAAVVADVGSALERAVAGLPASTADRTALVVTADHGHVDTDPERNVDLWADERVRAAVGTDQFGTPRFGGGPRNVHLHVDNADPARLRDHLDATLVGERAALTFTREEALRERLWGGAEPSDAFRRNCGDVVVVPEEVSVWHGEEADELGLVGMHGGLHPDEQLVPFAAVGLAAVRR